MSGWRKQGGRRHAEAGVTAIEYALLAAMIALAIMAAGLALRAAVVALYDRVGTEVQKAGGGS